MSRAFSWAGDPDDDPHRDDEPPEDVELPPLLPDIILSIGEYRATVPDIIPWVVKPLAYLGGVTLLAGPPKAGKSTLAANLQQCRETGERLLDAWDVLTGPTLLVTEEGGVAVVYKTNGLHALDVLDRRSAIAAGLSFTQMLDVVALWASNHSGALVFIDTLAIWAGIENENDASEVSRAVATVTHLAQSTGVAVVLVHHARKSGGDNGEAIRGSGAILATVDIAVELSRTGPLADDRWLDVQGRVILPDRHLLTFDRASMRYGLGDRNDARLEEVEADLAAIPTDGAGMTRNDITSLWGHDSRARIEQLINLGRMRKEHVKAGRYWQWRHWAIAAVEGIE